MRISELTPRDTMLCFLAGSNVSNSTAVYLYNCLCDLYDINALFLPKNILPEQLDEFFNCCKLLKVKGVVLTSPHKDIATDYMDEIDDNSKRFRSVNTIRFDGDKMSGHGFDGKGVIGAFDQRGVSLEGKSVLMIGAGGVAGVFVSELAQRGIKKITILNRTQEKARRIAEEIRKSYPVEVETGVFTVENAKKAARTADIFLQATTLGRKVSPEDYEDLRFIDELPKDAWVMEAVSNPPETALVRRARADGLHVIVGMEMQVCQVEAIFKFLFDFDMDDNGRRAATDFYCKQFNYTYVKD